MPSLPGSTHFLRLPIRFHQFRQYLRLSPLFQLHLCHQSHPQNQTVLFLQWDPSLLLIQFHQLDQMRR